MARLFKREYLLRITTLEGEQREISDLAINFEITKSILSFPNLAKITLFNTNADTRAALQSKDTRIELNAGYEDNTRLIFKGAVRNVVASRADTDTGLTIYSADGEQDWRNATVNITYSESVNVRTVINDVISTFKDSQPGALEGLPDTTDNIRGLSLSGPSKTVLDSLATEYGFEWSIQDGEVVTSAPSVPNTDGVSILVTPATGMIDSPTVTEIGADVTTLLNNQMLPNRLFRIESTTANVTLGNLNFRDLPRTNAEGSYKIQEVVFRGEYPRGAWTSSVKGITVA